MLAMGSGGDGALSDGSTGGPKKRQGCGDVIMENTSGNNRIGGGMDSSFILDRQSGRGDAVDYQIHVSRPAYTVPQLRKDLCYRPQVEQSLLAAATTYLRSCCHCSPGSLWAMLLLRLPILGWLPKYSVRGNLASDFVAGCTVAIMHLPQGMAYAMLAEVAPIYGLYTAFFPVLLYAILGTSRHISMGTFAVACLMTGKVVGELSSPHSSIESEAVLTSSTSVIEVLNSSANALMNITNNSSVSSAFGQTVGSIETDVAGGFEPIEVAVAVSLFVGIWQLLFGVLQLGQMCVFLSDMLISGFTTGAACHVLTSQVKHILGVTVQRYSGPYRLIYTYMDIFRMLPTVNPASIIMSIICITVLVINNEIVKPRLKKHTNFPMPIEMIAVILGTCVSYFAQLENTYNITTVGEIPTGLPHPTVPDPRLFRSVLMDSFVLAIVIYVISFSMAKIFSKKHGYSVDPTQELYAGGISNIFGSMFSSVPSAASLSRSLIQESVGGKTQVTSFFSCAVILIILLFVGPIFESLPTCVLASIIIVALKGMFLQVYDLQKMWKQSRVDSLLWIYTFLATVLIDIDYGLAIGVLFSLFLLLKRNNQPIVTRLGWVPNTDIYVNIKTYQSAVSLPGLLICRVSGALHFANCDTFKTQLAKATGLDISLIMAAKMKRDQKKQNTDSRQQPQQQQQHQQHYASNQTAEGITGEKTCPAGDASQNLTRKVMTDAFLNVVKGKSRYTADKTDERTKAIGKHNDAYLPDVYEECSSPEVSCESLKPGQSLVLPDHLTCTANPDVTMVVLCLSGVGWIDVAAAKQLAGLFTDYSAAGITMTLAAVTDPAMRVMRNSDAFSSIPENRFFHTIHDAVTYLVPVTGQPISSKYNKKTSSRNLTGELSSVATERQNQEGFEPTSHDARPAVVSSSQSSKRCEVTFDSCIAEPTADEMPQVATLHNPTLHDGHNPSSIIKTKNQFHSDTPPTQIRENIVDETINTISE